MGRKKIHNYEQTSFAKKISALQKEYGYTDDYVMEHIIDNFGNTLINDIQTYNSYKSGKRTPRDFPDILIAFSKFYGVTTDYLLEVEETPNHQVKAVKDVTGLSDHAVRCLMNFHDKYPNILMMVDTLLSNSSSEDITFFLNLYNQIYEEYKNSKSTKDTSSYNIEIMQQRFLSMQQMYNYISATVRHGMSPIFDKQLLTDEDINAYFNSLEYKDSIPDVNNDINQ